MNLAETSKIMAVLRVAYPIYYRGTSAEDAETAVNLWQRIFAAEPYELVSMALSVFISRETKGYPPSPGQIKAVIYDLLNPDELTEQQAWQLVNRAIGKADRYSTTAFDELPEDLQMLVGSNRQLIDWGQMDSGQVDSVVASNFQRSYREMRTKKRELAALPPGVQKSIERLGE